MSPGAAPASGLPKRSGWVALRVGWEVGQRVAYFRPSVIRGAEPEGSGGSMVLLSSGDRVFAWHSPIEVVDLVEQAAREVAGEDGDAASLSPREG